MAKRNIRISEKSGLDIKSNFIGEDKDEIDVNCGNFHSEIRSKYAL